MFRWLVKYRSQIQLVIGISATGYASWIVFISRDNLSKLLNYQSWILVTIILILTLKFLLDTIPVWLIISNLSGKSLPIIKWIKIMFVGRMANYLVPKSGGVYKAYMLKKEHEISFTSFINVYAFFSWLTISLNLGLAVVMIFIYMPTLKIGDYSAIPIVGGVFLATLLGPLAVKLILDLFAIKTVIFNGISEKVYGIFITLFKFGYNITFMSKLIGILIIKFGLNVLLLQLIFSGMKVEIGYEQIALFVAVQQVSIIIFITPGNIGIRELLYGVIGGAVGIGVTEGVLASAILRAIEFVVIFSFGFIFGGSKVYRSLISQKRMEEGM